VHLEETNALKMLKSFKIFFIKRKKKRSFGPQSTRLQEWKRHPLSNCDMIYLAAKNLQYLQLEKKYFSLVLKYLTRLTRTQINLGVQIKAEYK